MTPSWPVSMTDDAPNRSLSGNGRHRPQPNRPRSASVSWKPCAAWRVSMSSRRRCWPRVAISTSSCAAPTRPASCVVGVPNCSPPNSAHYCLPERHTADSATTLNGMRPRVRQLAAARAFWVTLAFAGFVLLLNLLKPQTQPGVCVVGDIRARLAAQVPDALRTVWLDAERVGVGLGTAAVDGWEGLGDALVISGQAYVASTRHDTPAFRPSCITAAFRPAIWCMSRRLRGQRDHCGWRPVLLARCPVAPAGRTLPGWCAGSRHGAVATAAPLRHDAATDRRPVHLRTHDPLLHPADGESFQCLELSGRYRRAPARHAKRQRAVL